VAENKNPEKANILENSSYIIRDACKNHKGEMTMNCYMRAGLSIVLLCGMVWGQDKKVVFNETYKVRSSLELTLRADGAEIQITKNDRDECNVFVEYNEQKCQLDVVSNEKKRTLSIDVDHNNWSMLKSGDSKKSDYAVIKIALPYKPDLDLKTVIKAGKIDMQLGDMHIRNLELKSWAGETRVDFERANRTELRTFDVDCKVGEVKLLHLGNANFQEADINSSVGEMTIDFTGEKIKRAMARLDMSIGSTTVIVPEEVAVKIKVSKFLFLSNVDYPSWFRQQGNYYYSKNYQDQDESLYLIASTGIGELQVRVAKSE
jgi:hypothetical protein